jgi:hypothetical protein
VYRRLARLPLLARITHTTEDALDERTPDAVPGDGVLEFAVMMIGPVARGDQGLLWPMAVLTIHMLCDRIRLIDKSLNFGG